MPEDNVQERRRLKLKEAIFEEQPAPFDLFAGPLDGSVVHIIERRIDVFREVDGNFT